MASRSRITTVFVCGLLATLFLIWPKLGSARYPQGAHNEDVAPDAPGVPSSGVYDITRFGGYMGPYFDTPTMCSITRGTATLSCVSALDFKNGNGILVSDAGPATLLATPQAPIVTPLWQTGTTPIYYCVASVDYYDGMTACSPEGGTNRGPDSFGQHNYQIIKRTSSENGTTVTITTKLDHNIPTKPYHSFAYPQVEITGMNSGLCNTDATITSVPGPRTFTISQQNIADSVSCSGGNVGVRTEVELKWDNHVSRPISKYMCKAGNTAQITVPNLWDNPTGFPSQKFIISGSSNTKYNGNFATSSWAEIPTLQFKIACDEVTDTGDFGGKVNFMQGHAVKVSLIYRCTGANCALPENAGNYTLEGVAEGDDTYFIDKGYGVRIRSVDLGQYPATAPITPRNEYLDTRIKAGGGTTALILTQPASQTVIAAKTWHDNVPNIYAACAAMPSDGSMRTTAGGTIFIPAPLGVPYKNRFPIVGNLLGQNSPAGPGYLSPNCAHTELRVAAPVFQRGTIEWNGNIKGAPGGHNCVSTFYNAAGGSLACFQGYAYPMFHFEPFLDNDQTLTDLEIQPSEPYQTGLLWDIDPSGNGTVGFWLNNVHADGVNESYPVVVKAGFGWFWKNGGWAANQTEYAGGRGLYVTTTCAGNAYQSPAQMPYIFYTEQTYMFGTTEFDDCGTYAYLGGDYVWRYPLDENLRGTALKFNTNNFVGDFTVEDLAAADSAGPGGPLVDFTNSHSAGFVIKRPLCAGPLFEINPKSSNSFRVESQGAKSCPNIGIDPVHSTGTSIDYRATQANTNYLENFTLQLQGAAKMGAGQIAAPTAGPVVTVSTNCSGYPVAGTYNYAVYVWDALGGTTTVSPSSNSVSLDGVTQCAVIIAPTLPKGSLYWTAGATSGPQTGAVFDAVHGLGGCAPMYTPVKYTTVIDQKPFKCGSLPNYNTTSLQAFVQSGFYGAITTSSEATEGQCFASAAPAICGGFINGFVTIAAGSAKVDVNTTAVTATSEISLTFDSTQGTNLGVTCNTNPQQPYISGRRAGVSFTISVPSNFSTDPGCIGFHIKN